MCRTRVVPSLSPSLAVEREARVRDMQVTTRYFIGPGKYRESLRGLWLEFADIIFGRDRQQTEIR